MRVWASAAALLASSVVSGALAGDLDRMERPPADWTGPVFVPSFDFPASAPDSGRQPWRTVDFRTDPRGYMQAVLAYVLEGQDRSTWRVQDNPVRRWYHAPWMGPGANGREFVNGLTRERSSRPRELGSRQMKCRQNWAVSFSNPEAGAVIGRVWAPVRDDTGEPTLGALPFPVGSVSAKLLFTEADASEVPLLAGAPEVRANIHTDPNPNDDACAPATVGDGGPPAPRSRATLRLLQLDVAVRDDRADATTGWVFGTFVYDGRQPGTDPWAKVSPVGLMWGNDPQLTDTEAAGGRRPSESIVLSDFGFGRPFGRGNRMNGPVDNPASACLSCHMTAQWPNPANMAPRPRAWDGEGCWFRNLGPATPFGQEPSSAVACGTLPPGTNVTSLDFSLQLAVGRRNWEEAHRVATAARPGFAAGGASSLLSLRLNRDDETLVVHGVESVPITRGESPSVP